MRGRPAAHGGSQGSSSYGNTSDEQGDASPESNAGELQEFVCKVSGCVRVVRARTVDTFLQHINDKHTGALSLSDLEIGPLSGIALE